MQIREAQKHTDSTQVNCTNTLYLVVNMLEILFSFKIEIVSFSVKVSAVKKARKMEHITNVSDLSASVVLTKFCTLSAHLPVSRPVSPSVSAPCLAVSRYLPVCLSVSLSNLFISQPAGNYLSMFRIRDILVWIRNLGFITLTNGSGSGIRILLFRQWPSRCQQKNFFLKTSISTVLWLTYDFLSLMKNGVNESVFRGPPESASGFISQRNGSVTKMSRLRNTAFGILKPRHLSVSFWTPGIHQGARCSDGSVHRWPPSAAAAAATATGTAQHGGGAWRIGCQKWDRLPSWGEWNDDIFPPDTSCVRIFYKLSSFFLMKRRLFSTRHSCLRIFYKLSSFVMKMTTFFHQNSCLRIFYKLSCFWNKNDDIFPPDTLA